MYKNISEKELREWVDAPLWYRIKMRRVSGAFVFDLWVEDWPADGYISVAELREFVGA